MDHVGYEHTRVFHEVTEVGMILEQHESGIADEHDLCFLGGFPGLLRNVTGVWVEETDSLYDVLNGNVEAQSVDLPSYGVAVLTTHST